MALFHQHFIKRDISENKKYERIKDILKSWFEYGGVESCTFSDIEGHESYDADDGDESPSETKQEAQKFNAMIHRIVLMKCFGCSRDDLYLFDFKEDVLNGNMSNEGLKILQQTAEKAEKWRRRRNYAMFVSFYSKCVHMLEVVDRDATILSNFLINPDIQLKVASFL